MHLSNSKDSSIMNAGVHNVEQFPGVAVQPIRWTKSLMSNMHISKFISYEEDSGENSKCSRVSLQQQSTRSESGTYNTNTHTQLRFFVDEKKLSTFCSNLQLYVSFYLN